MRVIVLIGPPCAGKTSFALDRMSSGDVLIDWDRLASAVNPAALAADTSVRALVHRLRGVLMAHCLGDETNDGTAYYPTSFPSDGDLERWLTSGAQLVMIDPGIETCLERADERPDPTATRTAIEAWYADPPELNTAWLTPAENLEEEPKGERAMLSKSVNMAVRATSGEQAAAAYKNWPLEEGDFIAYASTFGGEPDSVGDVIQKGAFTQSLADWQAKGAPIPLLFGHRMDDPAYNIGHIVKAVEDEHGLLVWGRLDLEAEKGRDTYRLIKSRRLTQLSFAYDVVESEPLRLAKGGWGKTLKELKIHEVSLVPLGANRNTAVLAVKAAAEQVASAAGAFTKDERTALGDAIAQLEATHGSLVALLGVEDEDGTAEAPENDKEQHTQEEELSGGVPADGADGTTPEETQDDEGEQAAKDEQAAADIAAASALLAAARLELARTYETYPD